MIIVARTLAQILLHVKDNARGKFYQIAGYFHPCKYQVWMKFSQL